MPRSSNSTSRVTTLHPAGKNGVSIARDKYDAMRRALLRVIPKKAAGVPFADLPDLVRPHLDPAIYPPKSSIPWYVVTVKQDLEAGRLIEQVPNAKPQRLRRTRRSAS